MAKKGEEQTSTGVHCDEGWLGKERVTRRTGAECAEEENEEEKRENFTRRRCWWSKRSNEKGVRDSETDRDKHGHRERETARQTERQRERRDFQGGKHPYER